MKFFSQGVSFDVAEHTADGIVLSLRQVTTNETKHRYQLGDARSILGRMYVATTILRSDRYWGLFPNDEITWTLVSTDEALSSLKLLETTRFLDYGY